MNPFALLTPLQTLVFGATTLVMVLGLATYLVLAGFRHEPPGFLRRTFLDATGTPNGVLLTVFNAVLMMNALSINGMLSGNWPPAFVWATWGTITLLGIGADTAVTRAQIEAAKTSSDFGAAASDPDAPQPGCQTDPTLSCAAHEPYPAPSQ